MTFVSSEEFVLELGNIGLTSLLHSKTVAKDCLLENKSFGKQTAEAYLQIAQYCRKVVEEKPEGFHSNDGRFIPVKIALPV